MKKDGKRTWNCVFDSIEKEVFPHISPTQKAHTVSDEQIILILANMINRGAATQSNRIRSYLHAAFNCGLKHDKDPEKQHSAVLFGLKDNPVTHIPKQSSAEHVGTRYLNREELTRLLHLIDSKSGISEFTGNIIKLCLFTGGQRPYELLTLRPEKIDMDNRVIEISEEFSKNKRSHLIPMTDTVLEIVEWFDDYRASRSGDFLVIKRTNSAEHFRSDFLGKAITRFCDVNEFPHFTPRDLRRTCKTHMGSIQLSKEIRDRIQNHAFADFSSKHYDRWEYLHEKRDALEKWESWLNKLRLKNNGI